MMKVKHPSIILKPTLLTGVVENTTKETPSYLPIVFSILFNFSNRTIRTVPH